MCRQRLSQEGWSLSAKCVSVCVFVRVCEHTAKNFGLKLGSLLLKVARICLYLLTYHCTSLLSATCCTSTQVDRVCVEILQVSAWVCTGLTEDACWGQRSRWPYYLETARKALWTQITTGCDHPPRSAEKRLWTFPEWRKPTKGVQGQSEAKRGNRWSGNKSPFMLRAVWLSPLWRQAWYSDLTTVFI